MYAGYLQFNDADWVFMGSLLMFILTGMALGSVYPKQIVIVGLWAISRLFIFPEWASTWGRPYRITMGRTIATVMATGFAIHFYSNDT